MRATIIVKEKFKKKWIIPLIIFIFSILFEYFLGNLLFLHSHNSITTLQNFMGTKIGLSNFNNSFNKNESSTKIEEEAGSTIFSEAIQYFNSNFFYVIICAIVFNLVNIYKITVLMYSLFLANFISATLSFIFHAPRPFMSYFSIKPAILFNDWGSPDNSIVVLISFYLTFYEIIIRNKKMDKSLAGKIIVFIVLGLIIFLDIFFVFAAGNLGYNQIIFSVCTGLLTYQIIFYIFNVGVNNSRQFYNFLKFKMAYYIFINIILLLFQIILFVFIIDHWDEDYYKKNIEQQQTRVYSREFFSNVIVFRKNFYLDKGNFNNVIFFAMNIICFLALKLELFWTFKGNFKKWSASNFETPIKENNILDYSNDEFMAGENTQWNHTGLIRSIIRLIFTIVLIIICFLPTIILYAWIKIEDNDVNGFICKSALPLFLMVFGIFYFFKPIFRLIGLAKKKDI